MNFTDTHTHLYDEHLRADADNITNAINAGVVKMFMPNCDSATIAPMLQLADAFPQHCMPMMGIHPTYIKADYQAELAIAHMWLQKRKFYAVGEIGLDYYWDITFKKEQILAFETQIDWAIEYNLPIIIHSRESIQDCIDIVSKKQNGKLGGIFHCFSGTIEDAKAIIELGLYLGIGGVITYKKSTLPAVVEQIPLDYLVLETDAPYLAPAPHRGKRNESSYIPFIAAKIAEIKKITVAEVAEKTTKNEENIFRL